MTDPTAADPTPGEPTKITRARAATSGVLKRATRPKVAAKVPAPIETDVPAPHAPRPARTPLIQEVVRAERVEIRQGGADRVEADRVSLSQGGITSVDAREVDVQMGGIAYAHGEEVAVRLGGVGLARADRVTVERGWIGAALAREANLTQVYARSVLAQDVRIDQAVVGSVVTGRVTFERPSGVLMLIAGRVDGPVKAVLDWRGALAFGAAFGLVAALIRGLTRRR